MTTKHKFLCGTFAALVFVGTILFALSPNEVAPMRYLELVEHPDASFKLLDSKVTRQSVVDFVCRGNIRCKMRFYTDRVLGSLGLRKRRYQVGGTADFLSIIYQSEKLTRTSCAQPFFKDERNKTVFPISYYSKFDVKTGTGTLTMTLPNSLTNGWKLHLNIPPDGKGFRGGKYAVFKM